MKKLENKEMVMKGLFLLVLLFVLGSCVMHEKEEPKPEPVEQLVVEQIPEKESEVEPETEAEPKPEPNVEESPAKGQEPEEELPEQNPDQLDMEQLGDWYMSSDEYDEMVSNSDVGVGEQ